MIKSALLVLMTCLIAIAGGSVSVALMVGSDIRLGAVRIGPWTAYPQFGTVEADPYAKAETSIKGILAIGRTEGIAFLAERDDDGRSLNADCSYVLKGETPAGRFWTLRSEPTSQTGSEASTSAMHSQALVRQPDNTFEIAVARRPHPGNWLPVTASGDIRLVLTVYDTPTSSGPASTETKMPAITRVACDA